MKRTLDGTSVPAITGKSRHGETTSGAATPVPTNSSVLPRVYSRHADLIEDLKKQTEALDVKNGNFMTKDFVGTSVIGTPASGQLLPIPYSPYLSPFAIQPLTPRNALPSGSEVYVLHGAASAPEILKVKSFLLELQTDILISIILLLDRRGLYSLDASCKKLNELAAAAVPGSKPESTSFKVRPYCLTALPGEFDLNSVSTYPKTRDLFEQGLDRTRIFRKVGLRNDAIFTSAKEFQQSHLAFFENGNQIRHLRVKVGSAGRFKKFLESCRKAHFGNDCSVELIFNPKRVYGQDDEISLGTSTSLPVRSLVLDRYNQIAVLTRTANGNFDQIKRLALGHSFHHSRLLAQGSLKQLFPSVEELALTSTESLQFYLNEFPDITALSLSTRWDTGVASEFDPHKVLATKLETLCLDAFNFEEGALLGLANKAIQRTLQSLYLVDCYETPLNDLKELIRQLPELKNLVLADFQGLSEEDVKDLIAWAATQRPKLRIQTL